MPPVIVRRCRRKANPHQRHVELQRVLSVLPSSSGSSGSRSARQVRVIEPGSGIAPSTAGPLVEHAAPPDRAYAPTAPGSARRPHRRLRLPGAWPGGLAIEPPMSEMRGLVLRRCQVAEDEAVAHDYFAGLTSDRLGEDRFPCRPLRSRPKAYGVSKFTARSRKDADLQVGPDFDTPHPRIRCGGASSPSNVYIRHVDVLAVWSCRSSTATFGRWTAATVIVIGEVERHRGFGREPPVYSRLLPCRDAPSGARRTVTRAWSRGGTR